MGVYKIHHRIDTMLYIYEPFEFDGILFSPWDPSGSRKTVGHWTGGLLASAEFAADHIDEAWRKFQRVFPPLVDRIAVVGQCYTWTDFQPLLITKDGDDRFFCRSSKRRATPGLHFGKEQIGSLVALKDYDPPGDAFRYLREANNAITFDTRLAMLVSALEGLTEELRTRRGARTNRDYIADVILKDRELCDQIYGHDQGIRNQMLHGRRVDTGLHGSVRYNNVIYDRIIDYLNAEHGAAIQSGAVGVPRQRAGDFEVWVGYCQWRGAGEALNLQFVQEKIAASDSPRYLELIDKPANF